METLKHSFLLGQLGSLSIPSIPVEGTQPAPWAAECRKDWGPRAIPWDPALSVPAFSAPFTTVRIRNWASPPCWFLPSSQKRLRAGLLAQWSSNSFLCPPGPSPGRTLALPEDTWPPPSPPSHLSSFTECRALSWLVSDLHDDLGAGKGYGHYKHVTKGRQRFRVNNLLRKVLEPGLLTPPPPELGAMSGLSSHFPAISSFHGHPRSLGKCPLVPCVMQVPPQAPASLHPQTPWGARCAQKSTNWRGSFYLTPT